MGKRFDEYIKRKISNGILYQHTLADKNICGRCIYRKPWQNWCSKFNKKIEKVNQSGKYFDKNMNICSAFHHLPCKECLSYKIQKCDIQYYINAFKKKNPYKLININIDKEFKEATID